MTKKIYIFSNNKDYSLETCNKLRAGLIKRGWTILEDNYEDADLLACIGGDGTFLSFVHKLQFPTAPIIGINTGHLGFFQEANPENLEHVLDAIDNNDYQIQIIRPVNCAIVTDKNTYNRIGINEVLIRGPFSHITQNEVSIGHTKIQDFSGDGILISTPVGSTAYNYSLGGSLVSPDLNVLQLTPVAPMNTNAYRSFLSSVLLPASETITIKGKGRSSNGTIIVSFDGRTHEFNNVKYVEVTQSEREIHLIRFSSYNYWEKLSDKLL
ncbi:MAG: NAD(+)/NADH kinase [Clostridiales bacterium]|nr:NAD(+)/NADH kinase [Candidatus Crickella equi]